MKMMNRWIVVVWMSIVAMPLLAEEVWPPHIAVEGEAEVLLEPDYIEWIVDIRTRDKLPKIAREVNEAVLKSLLDIADKADIDEKEIVSGEPVYEQLFDDVDDEQPDMSRYAGTEVYRRLKFVMRDMDELDEMLDAVHSLGVFYAVHRKSSQYEATLRRVEREAVKEARQRAIAQAAALGQNIGKAIEVDVFSYSGEKTDGIFGPPPKPIEKDRAAAGPNGMIHVRAYADVRFSLE